MKLVHPLCIYRLIMVEIRISATRIFLAFLDVAEMSERCIGSLHSMFSRRVEMKEERPTERVIGHLALNVRSPGIGMKHRNPYQYFRKLRKFICFIEICYSGNTRRGRREYRTSKDNSREESS